MEGPYNGQKLARTQPLETMPSSFMHLNLLDASSTEALGMALARSFRGAAQGAVLYLQGDLGTGKTTCARSLLRTLGVTGPVRSPTYTLVDTYELPGLACTHVDLYRLQSTNEVQELGLRDLAAPGGLMLIEWPEKGGNAVPPADLTLQLDYRGESRQATLTGNKRLGVEWLTELARDRSLMPYVSNIT
jgi:tRNA threonylcarbamoyladenosine biosynthesis protein TsaE